MSPQYLKPFALGALLGAFGLQAATTIPAEFAYPLSAASAANRGFSVVMKQATTAAGTLPNSNARTEAQLAGTLINSKTGQPHTNTIDFAAAVFNADGTFTETTTINYEQAGSTGQNFPGIPGLEGGADNIAMEVVSWLELQAGTYSMIVNSDDGFRVTVGKEARDKATALVLGEYDGGRGANDSIFDFTVTQAGVYSFRLIYEEGGGGANCAWFTAPVGNPDGRVLVNADGGVKSYSKITAATPAYLSLLEPANGATGVSPGAVVTAVIKNGSAGSVASSSVKLTYDGAVVAAVVSQANGATKVTYDPPGLLEPGSKHTVVLEYADGSTPKKLEYSFTSAATGNITLPTPIWLENFDTTAEGAVPTGWTRQNYTTGANGTVDYDDPNSDAYLNWVIIPKTRVESAKWDGPRRLNITEQFVNGEAVKSLINGNFLYAESDNRGGSQVQYAFSPDVNLTGKTNIYLSFHNIYEQNQDSIGSVEYSIDKGATWLPVLYMLDGPDIVKDAAGNVDGYATMIATNGDTAAYEDPITGEARGKAYGSFIGVATNEWKNIGPFISARINDDPWESKRLELFRLPRADNQGAVRLRFAQAGTGSWYFGIDDVGFHTINSVPKPVLAASPGNLNLVAGGKATFIAEGRGESISYQWQLNSNNIVGATNPTFVITSVKLSDSGNYRVVVSNKGGSVTSADAVLKVSSPLADLSVLSSGLVAYLPFDGDYTDLQGAVSAKAVGSPTFEAGKRGQGIHVKNLKDGSLNNYVTLGYPNALKFGDSQDFTVSFWVKQISQAGDQAFISNKDWNSSNNRGWGIFSQEQPGSTVRVQLTGPNSVDKFSQNPAVNLPDAVWHLITVAVARTGNVDTYVDGALVISNRMTAAGNIDTDDLGFALNLGQDGTGKYTYGGTVELDAILDEVAVWNRALNSQEAMALYSLGNAGQSIKVPAVPEIVTVLISSINASGGEFEVPILVNNFKKIETIQLTLGWDPNLINFSGVSGFGLPGLLEANFGVIAQNSKTNKITFSWDDATFAGVTLTNGTRIFSLKFRSVTGANGKVDIKFESIPTPLEISSQSKNVNAQSVNGVVTLVSAFDGLVEYYAATGGKIAGVKLEFSGGGTAVTDVGGVYRLLYLPGANQTVTPSLATDNPTGNGVTTADITLIRRHVLGLALLDSPYKVMAGDVNGSDSVTTADITLIRRLILGVSTNFPSGLWRFVPSDEVFSDPLKPWVASRMRRYATLAGGNLSGQDFKAIKLGDVNGSWKAPTATTGSILKSKAKGRLTVGKVRAEAGKTVTIPVSLAGVDRLGSAQMTLSWDASAASYEGVEGLSLGGLTQENLGLTRVNEGVLSVSWDHPSGRVVDLTGTAGLFQLKLRPTATTAKRIEIRVTEGPTRLELTDGDTEVMAAVDSGWLEIGAPGDAGLDSVSLRFMGLNSDGRMELEARGPEGMKLKLEASDTLKTWAEVQSVTGQGPDSPVKLTLQPDPNVQAKFWRVRVR